MTDKTAAIPVQYSVILPMYNEESCLSAVLGRTVAACEGTGQPYEIICVDDCSTDSTWTMIGELHRLNPRIKGIRFLRNFGHQLAVYAGIRQARGAYVAVMDADGQDPPEILPDMFGKCRSGYDVVYAVRRKRKEGRLKRAAYAVFYRVFRALVPFEVPLDAGDFSVFTRRVADFIGARTEKAPFIRGLRSWHGGKQLAFEYERQARISGATKYPFFKLVLLALNASISFSKVPLRVISIMGIALATLSLLGGVWIIAKKIIGAVEVAGWASTAVLIVFFGGLNLFVLGIIGEYVGDIFDEVKNRPQMLIGDMIGIEAVPAKPGSML